MHGRDAQSVGVFVCLCVCVCVYQCLIEHMSSISQCCQSITAAWAGSCVVRAETDASYCALMLSLSVVECMCETLVISPSYQDLLPPVSLLSTPTLSLARSLTTRSVVPPFISFHPRPFAPTPCHSPSLADIVSL